VLEVAEGEVNAAKLSKAQRDGAAGLFAQCMSGYVRWLATQRQRTAAEPDYDATARPEQHRRTSAIGLELLTGWRFFTEFLAANSVLNEAEAEKLRAEAAQAIEAAAQAQGAIQADSNPVDRFVELLLAALTAGRAHVADMKGAAPNFADMLGWRPYTFATSDGERNEEYRPSGDRIGFIDTPNDDLFLDPHATFKVIQEMARAGSGIDQIPVGVKTLNKRLHQAELLKSADNETATVRRTIMGMRRRVLHLDAKIIGKLTRPA